MALAVSVQRSDKNVYIYIYTHTHKEEEHRDDCRGLICQLFALSRYVIPGWVHDRLCVPTSLT